jgi:DNA-binding SARP family transcriptional activator
VDRQPLVLRVLGPPTLCRADAHPDSAGGLENDPELLAKLTPRQRDVLVLLALHPDGISRPRAAGALWPDSVGARPLNTLHNTLARLRQRLRDAAALTEEQAQRVVTVEADRCRLNPDLLDVDYWRLDAAVTARRRAGTDAERDAACQAILDAYGGELAEHDAADWLEVPRETARRDAVDAATRLARANVGTDPRRSLELLETARGFDPYNEPLYVDIMRIQRRLGRADAITRTLALLTTRLAEIDETPSPATLEFAARLQRDASPNPETTRQSPTSPAIR